MLHDPLANTLSAILNGEGRAALEVSVTPSSKFIKKVLEIIHENRYLGEFKEIEDGKGKILKISLIGKINKCGAIKPRFAVPKDGYEKYEKRFLLAKDFGIIIVSTSKGLMTHIEAKKKKLGGRLVAYCY
jgi:small subunit ribosomal protein S8